MPAGRDAFVTTARFFAKLCPISRMPKSGTTAVARCPYLGGGIRVGVAMSIPLNLMLAAVLALSLSACKRNDKPASPTPKTGAATHLPAPALPDGIMPNAPAPEMGQRPVLRTI